MSAKRSPILGYNHNVRYRGVVFHVQTEDSGIGNPHVFTHLFQGGTILASHKVVYDPTSSEEVVKSLMQAQHKAAMKELRRGVFDDKIDRYLVDLPGLLPRGSAPEAETPGKADDRVPIAVPTDHDTDATPVHSILIEAPDPPPDEPSIAAASSATAATFVVGAPPPTGRRTAATPVGFERGAPPPTPVPERRAAGETPPGAPLGLVPTLRGVVAPSESAKSTVSAVVEPTMDYQLSGEAVVEIHSPAPPSAEKPPGLAPEVSASEYSVSRRSGGTIPPERSGPTAGSGAANVMSPRWSPPVPRASGRPTMPPPVPTAPRGAAVPPQPPSDVRRPQPPAIPRVPSTRGREPATPPAAIGKPPKSPTQPFGPRVPSGAGGVVVSRPAVIVGAPPQHLGGARPAPARSLRDSSEPRGGEVVTERSLDEVILAYLSEDTSDE